MNITIGFLEEPKPRLPKFFPFIIGVIAILITLIMVSLCHAQQMPMPAYTDAQIANAIYKAENSPKYPYGVRSVKTGGNVAFARKVCLNSIRNARKRYLQSGCQGDFIAFMGLRYSPPAINPNWVRLVHYFLGRQL